MDGWLDDMTEENRVHALPFIRWINEYVFILNKKDHKEFDITDQMAYLNKQWFTWRILRKQWNGNQFQCNNIYTAIIAESMLHYQRGETLTFTTVRVNAIAHASYLGSLVVLYNAVCPRLSTRSSSNGNWSRGNRYVWDYTVGPLRSEPKYQPPGRVCHIIEPAQIDPGVFVLPCDQASS